MNFQVQQRQIETESAFIELYRRSHKGRSSKNDSKNTPALPANSDSCSLNIIRSEQLRDAIHASKRDSSGASDPTVFNRIVLAPIKSISTELASPNNSGALNTCEGSEAEAREPTTSAKWEPGKCISFRAAVFAVLFYMKIKAHLGWMTSGELMQTYKTAQESVRAFEEKVIAGDPINNDETPPLLRLRRNGWKINPTELYAAPDPQELRNNTLQSSFSKNRRGAQQLAAWLRTEVDTSSRRVVRARLPMRREINKVQKMQNFTPQPQCAPGTQQISNHLGEFFPGTCIKSESSEILTSSALTNNQSLTSPKSSCKFFPLFITESSSVGEPQSNPVMHPLAQSLDGAEATTSSSPTSACGISSRSIPHELLFMLHPLWIDSPYKPPIFEASSDLVPQSRESRLRLCTAVKPPMVAELIRVDASEQSQEREKAELNAFEITKKEKRRVCKRNSVNSKRSTIAEFTENTSFEKVSNVDLSATTEHLSDGEHGKRSGSGGGVNTKGLKKRALVPGAPGGQLKALPSTLSGVWHTRLPFLRGLVDLNSLEDDTECAGKSMLESTTRQLAAVLERCRRGGNSGKRPVMTRSMGICWRPLTAREAARQSFDLSRSRARWFHRFLVLKNIENCDFYRLEKAEMQRVCKLRERTVIPLRSKLLPLACDGLINNENAFRSAEELTKLVCNNNPEEKENDFRHASNDLSTSLKLVDDCISRTMNKERRAAVVLYNNNWIDSLRKAILECNADIVGKEGSNGTPLGASELSPTEEHVLQVFRNYINAPFISPQQDNSCSTLATSASAITTISISNITTVRGSWRGERKNKTTSAPDSIDSYPETSAKTIFDAREVGTTPYHTPSFGATGSLRNERERRQYNERFTAKALVRLMKTNFTEKELLEPNVQFILMRMLSIFNVDCNQARLIKLLRKRRVPCFLMDAKHAALLGVGHGETRPMAELARLRREAATDAYANTKYNLTKLGDALESVYIKNLNYA